MKIVSPNFLAAAGCLSLLSAVTYAKEHQEQRVRVLQDADASLSMAAIGNSDWWGGGGWTPPLMTGSKSAKSDGGSAKSAKSEWEGVGKSSKSEEIVPMIGEGPLQFCDDETKDACYQVVKSEFCPVIEPTFCNGLETIGTVCIAEDDDCDDLNDYEDNCSYYGYGGYRKLAEGERKLEKWYDVSVYTRVACPGTGSKSSKSESTGAAKSSKSEPSKVTGEVLTCDSLQLGDVCYQPVAPAFCPTEELGFEINCNGLEVIGSICEGDQVPECNFNDELDNCLEGADVYMRVPCPGASKSAKSESIGDWSKSAKSESIGDWSKSAKSESIGDWSKSAKSDGGSAKSAKSEWEGVGDWSKSSKSKSAKSAEIAPVEPPMHGMEWVCGWSSEVNVVTEKQVGELIGLITSVATKENIDGLLDQYDINEDTVAAALEALGGL